MTVQDLVHVPSQDITPHDKIPYRANLDAALLALKPETKRAYTRALRQYAAFCTLRGWERPGQPALTDHVGCALWLLKVQETRRGHSRGKDPLAGNVQPHRLQSMGQVARRVQRVVGQHQEFDLARLQPFDKLIRAGNNGTAADKHAVHVDKIVFHRVELPTSKTASKKLF